ncbi:MAG: hypothetical protein JRG73_09030 [Deltaproteobacteria bacterium]|nr:hypothetical protein [Deltaproteobacteria bacterium]MBW2307064.1 hypothetical protein [Deltaproteobacteria bacterium]
MIRRRGLLNLFLLALVLWAGFQVYSLVFLGSGGRGALSDESKKIAMVQIPPPARIMESEKAYEDVMEKNLFRPERTRWRPPAAPQALPAPLAAPPPPPPPSPPPITLQGIILAGTRKVALLNARKKGSPEPITVRASVGDEVAGARVHAIEEDRIILQWNQDHIELHVHKQNGQKKTNEPMPENIPLLLTEEEMAIRQINLEAKSKKRAPPPAQVSTPVSPLPPVAKGDAKAGKKASKPSHPAKVETPELPARSRGTQQNPAHPLYPSTPQRRFPYSIFAPRK